MKAAAKELEFERAAAATKPDSSVEDEGVRDLKPEV